MSLDSRKTQVRWLLAVFITGLVVAPGCQPGQPNGPDSGTDELTDEEVIADLREFHPLMTDLPPIPLPAELAQRDDDTAKEALDLLNQINSFRNADPLGTAPWDAAQNSKSARRLKGDGWQKQCDPLACYYTRKQGDLTIRWTYLFGLPGIWESFFTWDGCDGEHEYDDFMHEHWHMTQDLTLAIQTHYQYPDPPPCGDGEAAIGPGVQFRWIFELIEGGTLYMPGQVIYLDTRRYTTEQWHYHAVIGEYLVFNMLTCTSYPDGRLIFEHYSQKVSQPRLLYLSYKGIWSSDHRYCWTTYREDETVLSCGGDMGCPDCEH